MHADSNTFVIICLSVCPVSALNFLDLETSVRYLVVLVGLFFGMCVYELDLQMLKMSSKYVGQVRVSTDPSVARRKFF